MPLTIEIAVIAEYNGKPHNNIFHVIEDTGLETLDSALDVFETNYLPLISAAQVDTLVYTQLTAKPLDILDNRTPVVRAINVPGAINTAEKMPAGNHVWTVFDTPGVGLKAGGKMISGFAESSFTGGEPIISLLDDVEAALGILQLLLQAANFFLAVFRPAFSLPGVPVASIVTAIRTRGDSTNNRRMNPFLR